MINKRSLLIVPTPNSTMLAIRWDGGGEVPHELQGHYTSRKAAIDAIAVWKSKEAAREEVAVDEPREEPLPRRASRRIVPQPIDG
jgi:hypothetical protein